MSISHSRNRKLTVPGGTSGRIPQEGQGQPRSEFTKEKSKNDGTVLKAFTTLGGRKGGGLKLRGDVDTCLGKGLAPAPLPQLLESPRACSVRPAAGHSSSGSD